MADFAERLNAIRNQQTQAPMSGGFSQRLETLKNSQTAPIQEAVETPVEREEEPWYEDLGEGLGVSGLSTYYGIKDLVVGLDDDDMATLKDWQEDAAQSGWGTAGEIVGDIAQIALPAGGALKAAKAANMLKNAGRTAPLVADVITSGGVEALKLPKEGESRTEAGLEAAKDAALGGVLARTLSKMTRGVDITDEAKALIDKGGFITAGKAAKSPTVSGFESVAEVTPFLAKSVKKAQSRARNEWEDIILADAAPAGVKITKKGQEGVRQLRSAYDDAYTKAWAKADNISNTARAKFVDDLSENVKYLPTHEKNKVISIAKDFKNVVTDITPDKIKAYDNRLRREIDKVPFDNRELRSTLKKMRENIRSGIPKEATEELKTLDKEYAKYLVVKKATAKAAETKGDFTPNQLMQAVKSVGGETRTALGDAPMQDLATIGTMAIGKKLGGQPLEWFRRVAGALPSPIPTQTLSNIAIGQNPMQRLVRQGVESAYVDALRNYLPRSGQVSSAVLDDEQYE